MAALEREAAAEADRQQLLEVLSETYVEYSLGEGKVYYTVAAARTATEDVAIATFDLTDAYCAIARDVFGVPAGRGDFAMFLGAADNLVAAVGAGLVAREAVPGHLVNSLTPLVTAGDDVS